MSCPLTAGNAAVPNLAGEENVMKVANSIVEESMAEAATLVYNLFQQHRQKRASEVAASVSVATDAAAAGGALPENNGSGLVPQQSAALENGNRAACNAGGEQESSSAAAAVPSPPQTQATVAVKPEPVHQEPMNQDPVKQEPDAPSSALAATFSGSKSPQAVSENPSNLALLVDDESLMDMSTKLTAMFIAIQLCVLELVVSSLATECACSRIFVFCLMRLHLCHHNTCGGAGVRLAKIRAQCNEH
jgi:hypothetical protein